MEVDDDFTSNSPNFYAASNGIPSLARLPALRNLGDLPQSNATYIPQDEDEEEDEEEWEEVDLSLQRQIRALPKPPARLETLPAPEEEAELVLPTHSIEITLDKPDDKPKKRVNAISPLDRQIRLQSHKLHTLCLLASFSLRNRWSNDPLLHARLLSLTPLDLQTNFSLIHKKREPDVSRRAKLFRSSIQKLLRWWIDWFRVQDGKGVRSQTFWEVELERLQLERDLRESRQGTKPNNKEKRKQSTSSASSSKDPELYRIHPLSDPLHSSKSLMKHALMRSGSADTSAILFTSLCRALDVPARLVVNLQAVPWSTRSEKLKLAEFENLRTLVEDAGADGKADDGMPYESGVDSTSRKRKGKGNVVNLKRSKPRDRKIRAVLPRMDGVEPPLEGWPPGVWTEVYSRPEGKWIPIDPIRYLVDKRKLFEPSKECRVRRMDYVVGFEEDGHARDITPRYASKFGEKTSKDRAGTRRGQSIWWELVMACFTREWRLARDDIEDNEFRTLQYWEGMPTSIGGFKDHPIYALERHLRRDEVIFPRQEIGKFRGEPVFSRSNVQRVRTAETWLREGRIVKIGQQPLKRVAQRASTINRKRILEAARLEGGGTNTADERKREGGHEMESLVDGTMQGLYAMWQTELYVPDPVIDGVIPKNDFGNINLFVESMLPYGATHLPYQGIAKTAKTLGIDFAPAVTGFEFRKGHANPTITGIVVASENEDVVLSAYWESAQAANEAEAAKRHDRVIRRWTRLVQGLRLRKRLQEEYGNKEALPARVESACETDVEEKASTPAPGGFLAAEYEGVIEHFNLPKTHRFQNIQGHEELAETPTDTKQVEATPDVEDTWTPAVEEPPVAMDGNTVGHTPAAHVQPKTLRQRAAEHFARKWDVGQSLTPTSPPSTPPPSRKRKATKRAKGTCSPSDEDSDADFESEAEAPPKRTRKTRRRHSPEAPRRQLRPRIRK